MRDPLKSALAVQRRAAREGFDWPRTATFERLLWRKLQEEITELRAVRRQPRAALEELGDLLFMVVNVARYLDLDPSAALRAGNRKFLRRFGYILAHSAALPRRGDRRRLAAMERLWQDAKRREAGATPRPRGSRGPRYENPPG